MSILDKRMDLAGHEINPGQEAQRTMALILVIPGEGRMTAGFRRQVRRRRADRLHAGFLVVRDDGLALACLGRCDTGRLQDLYLFVNAPVAATRRPVRGGAGPIANIRYVAPRATASCDRFSRPDRSLKAKIRRAI